MGSQIIIKSTYREPLYDGLVQEFWFISIKTKERAYYTSCEAVSNVLACEIYCEDLENEPHVRLKRQSFKNVKREYLCPDQSASLKALTVLLYRSMTR